MATATKMMPANRVEKTIYASLGVLEKAGKEIAHLAREGQKRITAHDIRVAAMARTSKEAKRTAAAR